VTPFHDLLVGWTPEQPPLPPLEASTHQVVQLGGYWIIRGANVEPYESNEPRP